MARSLERALLIALGLGSLGAGPVEPPPPAVVTEARAIVEAMKAGPRGPYLRLRWYCKDGTIHPPQPYPCKEHGGSGMQHAEYSKERERLAALGWHVGTIFAAMPAEEVTAPTDRRGRARELPLERYLVDVDDGWVLRLARTYRGRAQIEDERAAGRELLLALLAGRDLVAEDWLLLRELVRTTPHAGAGADRTREMRRLSMELATGDASFEALRVKIHNEAGAGDIEAVRAWLAEARARGVSDVNVTLAQDLIERMEDLYGTRGRLERIEGARARLAASPSTATAAGLLEGVNGVTPRERVHRLASALRAVREVAEAGAPARETLALLDLSVDVEEELMRSANEALLDRSLSRRSLLVLAGSLADGAHGSGLLSARERAELQDGAIRVGMSDMPTTASYLAAARAFERSSAWALDSVRHAFAEALVRYTALEPKAAGFPDDLLRSSPMLALAETASRLARDAERESGLLHRVFGREIVGIAGLNAGAAIGRLRVLRAGDAAPLLATDVVVLEATMSELPPVAGILTVSEGNALSHVQMLARNLGIPNATLPSLAIDDLAVHESERVLFAVGSDGSVVLVPVGEVPPGLRAQLEGATTELPKVDAPVPDLSVDAPLALTELRAALSGKVVGPKAANVGELARLFPGRVAPSVALPFGLYASHAATGEASPKARFDSAFARHRAGEIDDAALAAGVEAMRVAVEALVVQAEVRARVRELLAATFGPEGTYGVFVRSDTNVEDLPEFTGAGLNRTIPNVVGAFEIFAAIPKVWASPFTSRAMAWRTRALTRPEEVYPSVLLMKSIPSEKSGVLATADVVTGGEGTTITMAWGVGGGVDGEISETQVLRPDGTITLVSEAKATHQRHLRETGGIDWLPSRAGRVLEDGEISQVRDLVATLKERMPETIGSSGLPAPWDVELGFIGGQLVLFQIRPLVARGAMRADEVVRALGSQRRDAATTVNLAEPPGTFQPVGHATIADDRAADLATGRR